MFSRGVHVAALLGLVWLAAVAQVANAQGPISNGETTTGSISPAGTSNTWTFAANVGDSIVVRVGEVSGSFFSPNIQLLSPASESLGTSTGSSAAEIAVTATNSGTFTVIISDNAGTGTGNYRLTLAKTGEAAVVAPSDTGGPLTNGITHAGTIDTGDLDLWTVTASAGEVVVVRMGEIDGSFFSPSLRIYSPTGELLDSNTGSSAAEVAITVTNSGTFLVVAGDDNGSFSGSGTYLLTLAKTGTAVVTLPDDTGGPLTNGITHTGTIDTGDLDLWTVTATAGEVVVVRMGEIDGSFFSPSLRIYSPTGELLDSNTGSSAAEVAITVTNPGTYLVVAGDDNGSFSGTGDYRITLAKPGAAVVTLPDDTGGPLTNGVTHIGTIDTGDLDLWTVTATAGEVVVVRMGEIDGSFFSPSLRIYSPAGELLDSNTGSSAAEVAVTVTNSGTFLVVARDDNGSFSGSGTYRLTLAQVPRAFIVAAGDEGGTLTNGIARTGAIPVGDLDLWSFKANAGDSISLQVTELSGSGFSPHLDLYGPNGTLVHSAFGSTTATSSNVAPSLGTYTVVVNDQNLSGEGTYQVRLDKFPPDTGAPLTIGGSVTNRFNTSGDRAFIMVAVPPGGHLQITLDVLNNLGNYEVYVRRGSLPTAGLYDFRVTMPSGADRELFIPDADAGPWFIMVYGASVPVTTDFTVSAEVVTGVFLTSIAPNRLGNLGPARIAAHGAGFGTSPQVVLKSGTNIVVTGVATVVSKGRLEADFNLAGVAGGIYEFTVIQGTDSASLPFEVVDGGAGQLETQLIIPDRVGRASPGTIFIEYANVGDAAMPAPLLVLQGSDRAKLSLDTASGARGLWSSAPPRGFSDTVQLLASGETPGILQPGERLRVPVFYAGLEKPWNFADGDVQFDLGVFDNTNTNAVDWDSLKSDLQPDGVSVEAWDVVWANFVANVGPTWGDYAAMLSDNAIYLGKLGLNITDISSLVAFELAQADGLNPVSTLASATDAFAREPGLNLVFGRVFPYRISQRFSLGSLGYGWSHNWDFQLQKDTNGVVTVFGPGGAQRVFQPDIRGGFFQQPGDYAKLTDLGSNRFQLTETDGLKTLFRSDGLLDYVEDLNGNRITANYTGGLLTSLSHSAGQSLVLGYTGSLLQSVIDPAGRVTTFGYDAAQHLTNVTYYGTSTVFYAYSTAPGSASEHAPTTITYPGGTHDHFAYDASGRLEMISSDGGAQPVAFSYDSAGTVIVTDALSNQSKFFFEHRGLLAKVENALGHAVRFEYDRNFNLTAVQAPDGASSSLTYDKLGNVTRTLDPAGNTIATAYAANARLSQLTDARSQSTSFNYDGNGNAVGMVYPNGGQEIYGNNPQGEVVSLLNRRGQTITLTRDTAGRITRKVTPEGRTNDFFYDVRGNLTNVNDSAQGATSLGYDERDLLTSITYPDGRGFTIQYDAAGRRTQRTSHDGYALKYFYDSVGRLEHLEDGTGRQIIQYLYDAAGRLNRENKGNNTWTTYEYDDAGQLLSLVNFGTNGVPISQFDYTYDANGNRTSMTTLAGITTYTYDTIGQLTGVTYPNGRIVTYAYDAAGNRTAVNDNGTNTIYVANNLNQYTQAGGATFSYDADGNLTNKTDTSGTTSYLYDSENRLVSVVTPTNGTWQYTYDSFGNRVGVEHNGGSTHYVHDPAGLVDVAAEYDDLGTLIARYDHGYGLVGRLAGAGGVAYYNFDAIGSTHELTDGFGTLVKEYDYDICGRIISEQGIAPNSYTFIGRAGVMTTPEGTYHMRTREYDQEAGRFMSTDLIGLIGGINLYTYAGNSPINRIDPLGLAPSSIWDNNPSLDRITSQGDTADNVLGAASVILEHGKDTSGAKGVFGAFGKAFGYRDAILYFGHGDYRRAGYELSKATTLIIATPIARFGGIGGFVSDKAKDALFEDITDAIGYGYYYSAIAADAITDAIGHAYFYAATGVEALSQKIPWEEIRSVAGQIAAAVDPNELLGPSGFGPANYLRSDGAYAYRINFENATNATAPAQVVVISNTIVTNLDLSTLEFTSVGFGDFFFAIPAGSQHYEHTEQVTIDGTTFNVNIEVKVDHATRQVHAKFESLMPDSELPPPVDVGFLPPEDGTGRGQGHVAYLIHPVAGLPTGTEIRNIGLITFDPLAGGPTYRTDLVDPSDPNSGIDTNRQALVTTDSVAPSSQVTGLSPSSASPFNVCWTASDDSVGSGVGHYTIYVSDNNGPFTIWLPNTNVMCAAYSGIEGHTYAFYSVASDNAGNTEQPPLTPDTSTTVSGGPPVADFDANPITGAAPLMVTFTDLSEGTITNRLWDFGDGSTSATANPSHTYTSAGTYTVSLTVFGPNGSDSFAVPDLIIVSEADPVADLEVIKLGSPQFVLVESNLTYTILLTNHGPSTATSILLADELPDSVTFLSATEGCTNINGTVECELGALLAGHATNVTVIVAAQQTGQITNIAVVAAAEDDSDVTNNTAEVISTVVTTLQCPDLTGTFVMVTPKCKVKGTNVTCSVKGSMSVQNLGSIDSPTSLVRFYLSADNLLDVPGDLLMSEATLKAVKTTKPGKAKVKAKLATGIDVSGQYVIAVFDAGGAIAECDEGNNIVVFGPLP